MTVMLKKLLIIFTFLIYVVNSSFGQQKLIRQLQNTQSDTARLRLFQQLGDLYQNRRHGKNFPDLDTASSYYLKALALSDRVSDTSKYSKYELLMRLGEIAISRNDVTKGTTYFKQSADHYHQKGIPEFEAKVWERLGTKLNYPTDADLHVPQYYLKAINIYQKLHNIDKVIRLYFAIAINHYYKKNTAGSEKLCLEVISKYKDTKYRNLELLYHQLALINRYNGNLNKALAYSLNGIKRMESTKDSTYAHVMFGEVAQVYQAIGDQNESIYYYKKTIAIRERLNMPQQFIFRTAGFVVQMLVSQNKAAEGLSYIQSLEKKHTPDSDYEAGMIAQAKAYCYDALGKTSMAEKNYLIMMYGLGRDSTDLGAIAHLDIAKFYADHKKFTQAAKYLEKLVPIDAFMSRDKEGLLAKVDSFNNQYVSAIDHFQRYKVINDSIFNIAKTKQIQQLQVEYETENKDKDIKLLKSNNLIQQGKVQQANYVRNVTLAGILLLALFLAFLYKGYRFKQRKNESLNQLITEKDGLLVEKDKLLVEKQWLLKEIHHRVKNNLAIVMGLLNRQSAYIDNEVALAAIKNSQNRMRSIALIHQKLYQSECLDLIQMPEYIEELIGHLKDSFDLGSRIIFEKTIDPIALDVSQAVPIGLIINEAVTNAIKYAFPNNVEGVIYISLIQTGTKQNELRIKDCGPGFNRGINPTKFNSLGMNLMKGLSKQINGRFALEEDNGITIKIVFETEEFVATASSSSKPG
ncbi:tetratricopeptide repeat-containing sensor histidine kinase [Mucilaginibacter terrenus]|nr:histidine kinase dimerization/phosphoacceptor domain -containing protein [Mucilaginibacter terrenus]